MSEEKIRIIHNIFRLFWLIALMFVIGYSVKNGTEWKGMTFISIWVPIYAIVFELWARRKIADFIPED